MYKITIKPGSENFVGEEKILDWSEIGAFKENGEMLEEVISVNLKFRAGELGIVEIERYAPKVDALKP